MPEVRKVKVYEIHELSPEAQKKAYEEWAYYSDYPWHDDNMKTLREFCRIFNIDAYDWEYGIGYGYIYWRYAGENENLLNGKGKALARWLEREYGWLINEDCPLTGYCMDEDILEPMKKFVKNPSDDVTLRDILNDCLNQWVDACSMDIEDYFTMENFKWECDANGWLFLEDGTPWKFGGEVEANSN